MIKEDKLQEIIYKWYNNNYCLKTSEKRGLIFAIPNGGTRQIREAVKLKATGVIPGVSDLIVITPNGKLLFVELKNEKGIQSNFQKEFELRVNKLGYEYHLIRNFEDFKSLILNNL